MSKVTFSAEVPDCLLGAFIQHIRDFDAAHPGCHFQIASDNNLTEREIQEMLSQTTPPFAVHVYGARKK